MKKTRGSSVFVLHHVEERTLSIVCIVLRGHGSRGDFHEIASGSFSRQDSQSVWLLGSLRVYTFSFNHQ